MGDSNIESDFTRELLREGFRHDGRKFSDMRDLKLAFGSQYGHVEVKLGKTWLAVQVSASVTKPRSDRPLEGIFHVSTEVSSMASPQFENGRQSTEEEITVSRMIEKAIRRSNALDLEALCIVAGHRCWMIRADVHYLNYDGNLVDATCVGVIAALRHYRRPDTSIDGSKVIIHTAEERPPVPLSVLHMPICVTWSFYILNAPNGPLRVHSASQTESDDRMDSGDDENTDEIISLIDATASEQDIRRGEMTITINRDKEICQITKANGVAIDPIAIVEYSEKAHKIAKKWTELINREIASDFEKRNKGNLGLLFGQALNSR